MSFLADYHMHTYLCGHATGQPEEYAAQAVKLKLDEIGFADHAPFVDHVDAAITMREDQMPLYHELVENVRKKFPKLRVKLGIEADFTPGYEKKTKALLSAYRFDYVIGSVHYINRWAFDNPHEAGEWNSKDVDQVYRDYQVELRKSASCGLFDIMGHVDLVKKFGHRATTDLKEEIQKTARIFRKAHVAIEINTSGLRKPVGEIYPSENVLKIYCEEGVPIVFGSDAHEPLDVGRDFDKAVALAKKVGYREYLVFAKRKVERRVKI